jgi:hypothetical protein
MRKRLTCNSAEKVTIPFGGFDFDQRMQKRASTVSWRFAVAAAAAAAVMLLISVAGLDLSAGMMATSRPAIGN